MAMNPALLRDAMKALIETVPGAGRVHTFRRVIRNEPQLKTLLYDDEEKRICAWMISPALTNSVIPDVKPGYIGHGVKGGGNVITTFQFQIEGIFQLNDADQSELVFQDLVWAVCDAFNAYGSIPAATGGAIPDMHHQLPCSVVQFAFINFANTALCHYARLEIGFMGRTRPGA